MTTQAEVLSQDNSNYMAVTNGPRKSLASKLSEILAEIDRIPKNGFNENQKYKYVTEADVSEALRKLLAKNHIFIFQTVDSVEYRPIKTKFGESTVTTVNVTFTIEDGETGETKQVTFPGEGADGGDKGIYKAMTGALKYFLLKTFLISSGDDPENEKPEHETRRVPQSKSQEKRFQAQGAPHVPYAEIPKPDVKGVTEFLEPSQTGPAGPLTEEQAKPYIKQAREYGKVVGGIALIKSFIQRETGKQNTQDLTQADWDLVLGKLSRCEGSVEDLTQLVNPQIAVGA